MQSFIDKYNIQEEYDALPQTYREALESSSWEQSVWNIAKEQGFLLSETNIVIEEVGLVLLGAEQSSQLRSNIKKNTEFLDSELDKLIRSLNALVFIPLQDRIKESSAGLTQEDVLTEIEDKKTPQLKETVVHKKLTEIFSIAPSTNDLSAIPKKEPVVYGEGEDPYHESID